MMQPLISTTMSYKIDSYNFNYKIYIFSIIFNMTIIVIIGCYFVDNDKKTNLFRREERKKEVK